ncbi:SAM and SH3 domain-containing protein 1 [Arapaima gigas]
MDGAQAGGDSNPVTPTDSFSQLWTDVMGMLLGPSAGSQQAAAEKLLVRWFLFILDFSAAVESVTLNSCSQHIGATRFECLCGTLLAHFLHWASVVFICLDGVQLLSQWSCFIACVEIPGRIFKLLLLKLSVDATPAVTPGRFVCSDSFRMPG